MKTYEVTLTDDTAALVDRMLEDGPWDSIDELVANSIGTLQEDVAADEDLDLDDLRAKLAIGLTDIPADENEDLYAELMTQFDETPTTKSK